MNNTILAKPAHFLSDYIVYKKKYFLSFKLNKAKTFVFCSMGQAHLVG